MHIDPQICEIHNRILWDWGLGGSSTFYFLPCDQSYRHQKKYMENWLVQASKNNVGSLISLTLRCWSMPAIKIRTPNNGIYPRLTKSHSQVLVYAYISCLIYRNGLCQLTWRSAIVKLFDWLQSIPNVWKPFHLSWMTVRLGFDSCWIIFVLQLKKRWLTRNRKL